MALLELSGITKSFGPAHVLCGIDLRLDEGCILCLLGPSGCGKTTLLRVIAGLERSDRGTVTLDGRDITSLAPHVRRFGMMFQDFALFPHLNVMGNVSFGPRMQGCGMSESVGRARRALATVGLNGYETRSVLELSGGERQRVALARTIACSPRLFLLDEPFGSLDRALRERLLVDVRDILKGINATCIFVTHDQSEAYAVSDLTAVMFEGRIVQVDPPRILYRSPASSRVARFLGLTNLLEGRVTGDSLIETDIGAFSPAVPVRGGRKLVTVLVQPDAARVVDDACSRPPCPPSGRLVVRGIVRTCLYRGSHFSVAVETPRGVRLSFDLPDTGGEIPVGQRVSLAVDTSGLRVLEG